MSENSQYQGLPQISYLASLLKPASFKCDAVINKGKYSSNIMELSSLSRQRSRSVNKNKAWDLENKIIFDMRACFPDVFSKFLLNIS